MSARAVRLFTTLFFFSGVAGLVYEVCWTRLLRLPMGNTVYSLTTVLTAFMGGLALGSYVAGRWITRHGHPLRVYAWLEAGIGIFCFVLPWLVRAEEPFFRWAYRGFADSFVAFHFLKFLACGAVILVPATLMGATLPVLCRYFIDAPERVGASVGLLYAANGLGAASGALLAGFVLVPGLGLTNAMRAGVATSLAVAALAWVAQSRFPFPFAGAREQRAARRQAAHVERSDSARRGAVDDKRAAAPVIVEPVAPGVRTAALLGYGLSGLAAMVFQVAWARVLSLVVGSSTYAFSLLVAAFILGLVIGSAVAGRVADRMARPLVAFAVLELGIALGALAMVPVFEQFPSWMLTLVPRLGADFARLQLVQFGLVTLALLVPTVCMGGCLPLLGRALVQSSDTAARTIGTAYAVNAVGTIAGAFLGGFVLLPNLGVQGAIRLGSALNLVVAVVLLVLCLSRRRGIASAAAAAGAGIAALAFLPAFDPAVLTSGAYLYASALRDNLGGRSLRQYLRSEYATLYEREGLLTTTTVRQTSDGVRSLVINGKVDASDGSDMATQVLSGHIAALLHPAPQDVAVIGLASGVTLAAVGRHPTVRTLDCIEIAPETIDACRLFASVNHGILDDPRVRLRIEDGRNHLALTDRQYDVIVSEPSNPWIAGIASLFTREFFEACRARLRPGGVLCIWIQMYGSSPETMRNVARTFQSVFPSVTLWESVFAADYLLVGSTTALSVDWSALQSRMSAAPVASDLERIGVRSIADLLVHYIGSGAELQAWIGPGPVYVDDRNRLEFDAPRLMYRPLVPSELAAMRDVGGARLPNWLRLPPTGIPETERHALEAAWAGRDQFWHGLVMRMRGRYDESLAAYAAALEGSTHYVSLVPSYVEIAAELACAPALAAGDTATAIARYSHLVARAPSLTGLRLELARLLAGSGKPEAAESELRAMVAQNPRNVDARLELAAALDRQGKRAAAEDEVRQALDIRPTSVPARITLGNFAVQGGRYDDAETEYRAALAVDSEAPEVWFYLGNARMLRGQAREAAPALERSLQLNPKSSAAANLLAECYRSLGEVRKADRVTARAAAR